MSTQSETITNIQFPPAVAKAICAVMSDVPKLAKGEKNTHGNFNFASIDDFLEAVRPLCAKHGLIIVQDEESFDTKEGQGKDGKPMMWLIMRFRFTLGHSSGEVWGHQPMRTIMVNAGMGSQAFGAAQSYALKQFMRSLFQIATGEKDADADTHPPMQLPSGPSKGAHGPRNVTTLKKELQAFVGDLAAMSDLDELTAMLNERKGLLEQAARDLPLWMETKEGSDVLGLNDRIQGKKEELEVQFLEREREVDTTQEREFEV